MSKNISTDKLYEGKVILAFVIEGELVDTFLCDERLAAILQSNPKIVDITGKHSFISGPHRGWTYDGEGFYPPQEEYN